MNSIIMKYLMKNNTNKDAKTPTDKALSIEILK